MAAHVPSLQAASARSSGALQTLVCTCLSPRGPKVFAWLAPLLALFVLGCGRGTVDGVSTDGSVVSGDAQLVDAAATEDPWVTEFLERITRRHLDSFTGRLPKTWSEADQLEALVVAHEATGDERLLDELAFHLDWLLEHTSVQLDIDDVVRLGVQPSWGTEIYACGQYFVREVQTGILAYPMAYFARVLLEDDELRERRGEEGLRFLEGARRAVRTHGDEFRRSGATGYYEFPDGMMRVGTCDGRDYAAMAGNPVAFNRMLSLGRAHLELSRGMAAAGNPNAPGQLARAEQMARFFLANLEQVGDRYRWRYAIGGRSEDTSHGALDLRFVTQAHAQGIVFDDEHLHRFARTFHWLTEDPSHVRSHLDRESSPYDQRWQRAAPRWLALTLVDPTIFDVALEIHENAEGATILSHALLRRWRPGATASR